MGSYSVGIDLGTTYSCVTCMTGPMKWNVVVEPLPSAVFFGERGPCFGRDAIVQGGDQCITEFKRVIGRTYQEIQPVPENWKFIENCNGLPRYRGNL